MNGNNNNPRGYHYQPAPQPPRRKNPFLQDESTTTRSTTHSSHEDEHQQQQRQQQQQQQHHQQSHQQQQAASRFPVDSMPWTDPTTGKSGLYTGEVDSSSVPDGKGCLVYDDAPVVEAMFKEGVIVVDDKDATDLDGSNRSNDSNGPRKRRSERTGSNKNLALSTIIESSMTKSVATSQSGLTNSGVISASAISAISIDTPPGDELFFANTVNVNIDDSGRSGRSRSGSRNGSRNGSTIGSRSGSRNGGDRHGGSAHGSIHSSRNERTSDHNGKSATGTSRDEDEIAIATALQSFRKSANINNATPPPSSLRGSSLRDEEEFDARVKSDATGIRGVTFSDRDDSVVEPPPPPPNQTHYPTQTTQNPAPLSQSNLKGIDAEFIKRVQQVEEKRLYKKDSILGMSTSERDHEEYEGLYDDDFQGGETLRPNQQIIGSKSSRITMDESSNRSFSSLNNKSNRKLSSRRYNPLAASDTSYNILDVVRSKQAIIQSKQANDNKNVDNNNNAGGPVINKSSTLISEPYMSPSSSSITKKKTKKRKCCLIGATLGILLLIGAAAGLCWYFLVYTKEGSGNDETAANGANDKNDAQSKTSTSMNSDNSNENDTTKLPWDEDTPCVNFHIHVATDKYGNETWWELLYEKADDDEKEDGGGDITGEEAVEQEQEASVVVENDNLLAAERSSAIDRKRLRKHYDVSDNQLTRRRWLQSPSSPPSLVLRNGPYPYLDRTDPTFIDELSGQYTSTICLPRGYYKFIIYDANGNGLCCAYGLGDYSLYFHGGREVYVSDGVFKEEEEIEFRVMEDDIIAAAALTNSVAPSQSPMPSVSMSMAPTIPPRVIPSNVQAISTITRDVILAGSLTSHGILFDIQMHHPPPFLNNSNATFASSNITIIGMDILIEATYSVEYEVWSKSGSWQDVNETNPDYHAGFHLLSNGTIHGVGTSNLTIIPLDEFQNVEIEGGTRQAFYVTLKESSLLFQNYERTRRSIESSDDEVTMISSPDFDVLYGSAVLQYPLAHANPMAAAGSHFRENKGFLGKIYYTTSNAAANNDSSSIESNVEVGGPGSSTETSTDTSHITTSTESNNENVTGSENSTLSNTTIQLPPSNTSNFTTEQASLTANGTTSSTISTSSPSPTSSSAPSFFPSSSMTPTVSSIPTGVPSVFDPVLAYTNSLVLEGVHPSSQFGFSTAMSNNGSILAVGAKDALNVMGEATGAVYLYSLDAFFSDIVSSTTASDTTSLPPQPFKVLYGESPGVQFGNALALSHDGKHLVVGCRSGNEASGAMRLYSIVDGVVTTRVKFTGKSPQSDRAGWSVAISGDGNVVAMGAIKGGAKEGGTVLTYKAPDWSQHASAVEGGSGDVTGYSIALSYDGSFMAVGSIKASRSSRLKDAGKVVVYSISSDGSEWVVRNVVNGIDEKGNLDGTSVGLSQDGSILVIGGKGYSGNSKPLAGRCSILKWQRRRYRLIHTIEGQTENEELGFSAAVSNDGNIIACGGVTGRWSNITSESGVVRLWNRLSSREKVVWPHGDSASIVYDAFFGSAVSLSSDGRVVTVGASTWRGTNENSTGAVHIFDSNW